VKQSVLLTLALALAIGFAGCGTEPPQEPSSVSEPGTEPTPATSATATGVDRQEREDVAGIHRLGGKATVDENRPGKPVIEVILCGSRVTDADLAQLEELKQLQLLDLNSTGITDEGLVYLKGLAQLKSLNLGGTKVTDAGVEHVKGLPRLQLLWLSGSKVSDAGLRDLRKTLANCQIVR
jgi:hypothetical protein